MDVKIRTAKNISVDLVDYDENVDFDEIVHTKWDLNSKLDPSIIYSGKFVKYLDNGTEFSLQTLQNEGFFAPLLFKDKSGLGLKLPSDDFTVDDVATYVGKNRLLDVVDVCTQDAIGMTMKDWCSYYKNPIKSQLLNVISLEYSQSKMDQIISAPDMVRQLDWLENCWPQNTRNIHVDNKSHLKTLTYPKVRKYCLMSVAGCYTDFHVDLGGTSVWYHIFKGEKIFWLVPPIEENLITYEKWCLSRDQSSCFFPDLVKECEKVHLKQGNTFMIPSGWIHGVYTPRDSLVFGGNFLHYLSIPLQLRIWDVEERIKIGPKYRYPFFIEMHWYALASFVKSITGKSYIRNSDAKENKIIKQISNNTLNKYEIEGIRIIHQWLKHVSMDCSKSIPPIIEDAAQLLFDAENICKSISADQSYLSHQRNGNEKKELLISLEDMKCNINTHDISTSKYLKLEISPLINTVLKRSKRKNRLKSTKAKAEMVRTAEIPHELFDKITQRSGSRQIIRPNRLVENPFM